MRKVPEKGGSSVGRVRGCKSFHSAIETYYRVKRGVTQIVRVERVELQPGAQAVIGVVARE